MLGSDPKGSQEGSGANRAPLTPSHLGHPCKGWGCHAGQDQRLLLGPDPEAQRPSGCTAVLGRSPWHEASPGVLGPGASPVICAPAQPHAACTEAAGCERGCSEPPRPRPLAPFTSPKLQGRGSRIWDLAPSPPQVHAAAACGEEQGRWGHSGNAQRSGPGLSAPAKAGKSCFDRDRPRAGIYCRFLTT